MSDPKEPANRPLSQAQQAKVEELYAKYHPYVFAVAKHNVGNEEEARDIVMAVFLRAMRHVDKLDHTARSPMPWFKLVTDQCCIDWSRRRRDTDSLDDFQHPVVSGTEDKIISKEAIQSCIEAVPDQVDFDCLLMMSEGYVVREIEETLGVTTSQVRTRIQRAKKFMKSCLESKGIGIDDSFIAE